MTHPVMWFEVLGTDGGKLRQFYGDLFGWTFDVIPPSDYGVAKTGDTRGIMGGIGQTVSRAPRRGSRSTPRRPTSPRRSTKATGARRQGRACRARCCPT